jgi:hypothetical protein
MSRGTQGNRVFFWRARRPNRGRRDTKGWKEGGGGSFYVEGLHISNGSSAGKSVGNVNRGRRGRRKEKWMVGVVEWWGDRRPTK